MEGRRKTSGPWRIRSTWTTCWYSEYSFNKQERIPLSLKLHVYRCCSVWKRKAKKNWCRKKAQLCMWFCVGVAQEYPRKPGTPSSSTALGRERVVPGHDLPVTSRREWDFSTWTGEAEKMTVYGWLMSDWVYLSDCIYLFSQIRTDCFIIIITGMNLFVNAIFATEKLQLQQECGYAGSAAAYGQTPCVFFGFSSGSLCSKSHQRGSWSGSC